MRTPKPCTSHMADVKTCSRQFRRDWRVRSQPPRTRWDLLQPDTSRVIDCGQSQQQRNEFVIPASVKEITGGQQNILAEGARALVEQRQHYGEEQKEMCGVEEHGSDHLAARSPGGPSMRATSSASIAENLSTPSRFRCIASLKNSGCSRESKRCSFARITLGRDANSRMELLRFFTR